jgi:hypothetical protein
VLEAELEELFQLVLRGWRQGLGRGGWRVHRFRVLGSYQSSVTSLQLSVISYQLSVAG